MFSTQTLGIIMIISTTLVIAFAIMHQHYWYLPIFIGGFLLTGIRMTVGEFVSIYDKNYKVTKND